MNGSTSNMESVDEILWLDKARKAYGKDRTFSINIFPNDNGAGGIGYTFSVDTAVAALNRREERLKTETRLEEAKQHPILSDSEENFRASQFRIAELEQQLKTLDGQENTNGE